MKKYIGPGYMVDFSNCIGNNIEQVENVESENVKIVEDVQTDEIADNVEMVSGAPKG